MKFIFDDAYLKAFECLKERLVTTPIVVSLDWSGPIEVMCDANGVDLGAVLGQQRENILHQFCLPGRH